MFEVKYCKVVGFQEALDILKLPGCPLPGDSYTTYVEDEKTLETAPYQFILGKEDLEYINHDENLKEDFLRKIRIYAFVVSDHGFSQDFFDTYNAVYQSYHGEYGWYTYAPEFEKKQFRQWVATLPYADVLGLLPTER